MSDLISRAETHEIRTETHGVCLISKDDAIEAVANMLYEEALYIFYFN